VEASEGFQPLSTETASRDFRAILTRPLSGIESLEKITSLANKTTPSPLPVAL
jgi:hypothetical protein